MSTHPLEPLVERYLVELDITKGTFDLYSIVLSQYVNYLKDHNIQYAQKADVIRYLNWKDSQGYSTHWMYHQIGIVKGLYRFLSVNHKRLDLPLMYATDITESIKNVQRDSTTTKSILTIAQAKQLLLYLKNNRKYIWHYRDYAIVYLMMTTGLRSIEIRRARIKDLRWVNGHHILYVQGKGRRSKDEFVKLSKGLTKAIESYLKKRQDHNLYLFVSRSKRSKKPMTRTIFNGMFKRILRDAGLTDCHITPHSLRHTAATLNLLRGGSLTSTKELMRHTKITNTLIYAHHLDLVHDDSEQKIEDFILNNKQ